MMDERQRIEQAIAAQESLRATVGDEVVDETISMLRRELAHLETPEQQRKLVTILYADIVGSTNIVKLLDPEDALEIMDGSLKRLAIPVEEHGGHISRFTGDGFKAVFGMPKAHENDPEMAIRAGLGILEAAQELGGELDTQRGISDFQVRVGINTGLAALGGMTESEDTVMGSTINLTKRVESAAPPGGLLITHNTYRHVRGVFDVEPRESITAKGFDELIPVYHVVSVKPRAFRVQTRGVEGVETRMVGRKVELIALQEAYRNAIEGKQTQVVTVVGEAGVGKSRLFYEFDNWIELLPDELRYFQGRGRQETQNLPYAILKDVFTFRFQIQESDAAREVQEKIEAGFGEMLGVDEEGQMRAHITGQLLGFDFSTSQHLKSILDDPQQIHDRAFMYLAEYFQGMSEQFPVVIILEDIHWADDSSLDMLNRLARRITGQRLLVVCVARHRLYERRPHWGEGLAYHRRLELQPLTNHDSSQLVSEILQKVDQIPDALQELVVIGAEGNPFYIEELIKMLVEDGVILTGEEQWQVKPERLAEIDVPDTLTGVLQARLEGLPQEERITLQQASVVGHIFWDDAVEYISSASRPPDTQSPIRTPDENLSSLRSRELVYRREESVFAEASEYTFKHAILRDVTYESVLKRVRKAYHGLVADWLIEHSAERLAEYAGLIAEHLLLAEKSEQALNYIRTAGEAALASYANPEAESYFRRALEQSPSDPDRAVLLSGLGEAVSQQGFSEEALQTWREAIDLFQRLGDSDRMADLYARSSWFIWHSGDYSKCWNLCQEALALMENLPDSPGFARLLAEAGRVAHFVTREIETESELLLQAALEMAEQLGLLEVQAEARITLAIRFIVSGDLQEAISNLGEVIALVETNGLLRTASRAHVNLASVFNYSGDLISAHQHKLRSVEISRQIGDFVGLLFSLGGLTAHYCTLGELQTADDILAEIEEIHSGAPESQAQYYLPKIRATLFLFRGQWMPAIETILKLLDEEYVVSDGQRLASCNLDLAEAILELNRFGIYGNYDLAESAIAENLEKEYRVILSLPLMIVVCARQRQFELARDWLAKVKEHQNLLKYDGFIMRKLLAEVELAFAEESWGESIAACQSLIEICQRTGYRWEWARRLIDLADAFMQRDEPGDQELARQNLQQSLDMFTEMGAPGYIKVLEERMEYL